MNRILAFDFDGVIHKYVTPWISPTDIPDEPVDGIKEVIADLKQKGYEIVVISSRCITRNGKAAVIDWLEKYGIDVDYVTCVKIPAYAYIDDRALHFNKAEDVSQIYRKLKSIKVFNQPEKVVQTFRI